MSLRILKAKHEAKLKLNRVNSRGLNALSFSNTGSESGKCCGFGRDPQQPSNQMSYGNYIRRSMNGLGGKGGPASRVQNGVGFNLKLGNFQQFNTVKNPPNVTTKQHIKNKKAAAIRCNVSKFDIKNNNCKTKTNSICYNVCGKKPVITKDLEFKSCSDQIDKKLALRAGNDNKGYETSIMNNNSC